MKISTASRRKFLAAVALGTMVLVLLCGSWAQWQVNQHAGWVQTKWRLDSAASLPLLLQADLDQETSANPNVAGQIVHVISGDLGLDASFASGPAILVSDDVRVASNIKPFIAAAMLKLIEGRFIAIDAPMEQYLSLPVRGLLQKSGRDVSKITIKQLLNHSSGIADYGNSRLFQALAYVPTAFGFGWHWRALDQIWFSFNMTTVEMPGTMFAYSDTNYLLLADIIENTSDTLNRATALRQILNWDAIGAPQTYWEGYEPAPRGTRLVRQFRGAIEDTHLDVSFDQHGGGGLVMDMHDLAHAHRAVVRGDVFKQPVKIAAQMTTLMREPGTAQGSGTYGLGLSKFVIAGEVCFGHGGRWGTNAFSCPDIDLTIARSWGQANANPNISDPDGLAAALVRATVRARAKGSVRGPKEPRPRVEVGLASDN